MSTDDLSWIGTAPLDSANMGRLRGDLILQRTVLWVPTGLIIALVMLLWFDLPIAAGESLAVLSFSLFLGLGLGRMAGNTRFRQIENALLNGLDIAPLLEAEGRGLTARFLGLPGGVDVLDVAMRPQKGGAMSKQKDEWGRVIYTTRAVDPKGPAAGSGADTIDARMPRIDGMAPRPEYEGIEGDLTSGEKLIEEANVHRDERSAEAWETSQSTDPELIEAGVEKLGDLVGQGHFEGAATANEFPVAPKRAAPNTPRPLREAPDEDPSQD